LQRIGDCRGRQEIGQLKACHADPLVGHPVIDVEAVLAESVAQLAGGEFSHFHDAKSLRAGLIALSNDVPNYYVVSFRSDAEVGTKRG
jgi:hypothetical protein